MVNHATCYSSLFYLFRTKSKDCRITFSATEEILTSIKQELKNPDEATFFVRKIQEREGPFLKRLMYRKEKFDIIIFDEIYSGSLSSLFSLARFFLLNQCRAKKFLIIHNVNKWLAPPIAANWKQNIKGFFRKFLAKKSDGLLVISFGLQKYIKDSGLNINTVFAIPFMSLQQFENQEPSKEAILTFCIAGGISPMRREYDAVLDSFEELWAEGHQVCLKLVGNFDESGQQLRTRCEKLQKRFGPNKVRFWYDRLDASAFAREVRSSHLFISNIKMIYPNPEAVEIYGVTKESGGLSNIVRHGLPSIALEHLAMADIGSLSLLRYSNSEGLKSLVVRHVDALINYDDLLEETRILVSNYANRQKIAGEAFVQAACS